MSFSHQQNAGVAVEEPARTPVDCIALLGRRDSPTDGVEDYCSWLQKSLAARGCSLRLARVSWAELGWARALSRLWTDSAAWRGKWVLVQYTALQWSRRGFSFMLLPALWLLRKRGARVAVVFHDPSPYSVRENASILKRILDRARSELQRGVMRLAYLLSARSILTIPLEHVQWLPVNPEEAAFIPVGANVPAVGIGEATAPTRAAVSVFSLSGGQHASREIADIAHAVRKAAGRKPGLRLLVFGRNSEQAEVPLRKVLAGCNVELSVLGLLPAEEASRALAGSDVLLWVRGPLTSGRGSAVAAVACGLPIVGYAGPQTAFPMTAAGAMLVPQGDREALSESLTQVLADETLRASLRERSRNAWQTYFSWDSIADRFLEVLQSDPRRNKERKVMVYAHSFAPNIGGVETYVALLADGLARRFGAKVTVVTRTPAEGPSDTAFPFPVMRQPGLRRLWRLAGESQVVQLAGPAFLPLLVALLRRKSIVVEHHGYQAICPNGLLFYEPTRTACPGHFMAGRYGKCVQCNAPALGWWKSVFKLLLTFPRRWMCQRVAANVAVTDHVSRRVALPRTRTIYHGVPDAPPAFPPATPLPCFAYIGRLVNEKGVPVLLRAAQRLRDEGRSFQVKIIGDGPERQCLESMTDNLRLRAHVTFTGFLRGEPLEAALQDVVAVVMPSIWEETAGLAAIEQMMRGRPVIASNIGGLAEIVDGAGLRFPPGDDQGLAACLRQVLQEPQLRSRIWREAKERATQFQQERMVQEHFCLFQQVQASKD